MTESKTKRCGYCKEYKTLDQFHRRGGSRDDLQYHCKKCSTVIYTKNRYHIRRLYGLNKDEYEDLIKQGCTICGTHKKLAVDHDHVTGVVRGVLCHNHNVGLGMFHDSIEELEGAIKYLNKFQPSRRDGDKSKS